MKAAAHPIEIGRLAMVGELAGGPDGPMQWKDKTADWECQACHRNVEDIRKRGHATDCRVLLRSARQAPKQTREYAVSEWPGLLGAIRGNRALRSNLLVELVRAYHNDADRLHRSGRPHTESIDRLCKELRTLSEILARHDRVQTLVGYDVDSGAMHRR